MSPQTPHHIPVMLTEAVEWLNVRPNHWYLDATFGRGGHSQAILEKGGKVLAFDYDQSAIEYAQEALAESISAGTLILKKANFAELKEQIPAEIESIAGILFDFGTSVEQLTDTDRGFSFLEDGPLDMRIDQSLGVTAADLLGVLDEKQMAQLFKDFGGEFDAKKIAHEITRTRSQEPIKTTQQLVKIIEKVKKNHRGNLHPATKVFQALRIAVNTELDNIEQAMPQALEVLASKGRIVTIAFHEGEDRIAKHFMRQAEQKQQGSSLTKKPLTPSEEELAQNPRARSAKLRVFEKR